MIVKCTIMHNLNIVGCKLPKYLCATSFLKELSPFVHIWYQSAASSMEYAFLVYHTCEHFQDMLVLLCVCVNTPAHVHDLIVCICELYMPCPHMVIYTHV